MPFEIKFDSDEELNAQFREVIVEQTGTFDYEELYNKPSIEGVELEGNKTAAELGLAKASDIPAVPVQSVNGQTGAVVLDAEDVGALPDDTIIPTKTSDLENDSGYITSAPVDSVNGKTGEVVLDADDVGAYELPSGGIPKTDLASDVQTSLGKADTALQSAPVTSVNGQTGDVTVSVPAASSATPQDLGTAAAGSSADFSRADHVHKKPTYSKGDVGLGNVDNVQQYSASNPPPYPVTSVNGSTGDVTVNVPEAATATPSDLGTAAVGNSAKYARENHVHKMPNASDVGATPSGQGIPSGGTAGQMLVKNSGTDYDGKWDSNAYRSVSLPFGAVDDTSTSTAFTVTVPGVTELRDGVAILVNNTKVNSAANCTLDVNNLGAKRIYSSMAAATAVSTTFSKGYTMLFVYDSSRVTGGCWVMYYGYYTNTTYTPPKLGFGFGTCDTAAATVAKTVSISNYVLNTGGFVTVKFTYDVPASATLNITSKGAKPIYYHGAAITAGIIKAGDYVTFVYSGNYYHLVSIDRIPTAADVGAIPAPASPTNGQYLKWNGSAWIAADAPGGGGGVTPLVLVATFNKTRSEALGYEEIYEIDESFSTIYDAYMAGTPITLVLRTFWDFDTPLDEPYLLYCLRTIEYDPYNYPSGLTFWDSQYRNGWIWADSGARDGHSYIETASQFNYYYSPGGGD